jgi:hypothetical protein|tara:strand:+ start:2266 stop:2427 length:162 start_codon:yes stop_codon:yes gene_type:complete
MKKNHKTIVKVTDLILKAWVYSLMGLTIIGMLTLIFGLITGEAQIPNSFGIYG